MRAAAGAVAALAGCSLILDFGGDLRDAGTAGDAAPTIDGGAMSCTAYEPNDAQDSAIAIEAGTLSAAVCPEGDRDWYAFSVDGAQDVVIELRFDNRNGAGDLDMLLFDDQGAELLPKGNGFSDVERIERTATSQHGRLPAGTYAVEVFAFQNNRTNDYTLELTIDPPTGGTPDAGPPDAGPPDA